MISRATLAFVTLAAFAAPAAAQDGAYYAIPGSQTTGPRVLNPGSTNPSFYANQFFLPVPQPDRERLTSLYQAGDGDAILSFLAMRAAEDQVWAMVELAAINAKGTIGDADPVNSLNWFAEAARHGHGLSALILGSVYARGTVIAPDAQKARYWLSMAQDLGDFQVQRDARKVLASL